MDCAKKYVNLTTPDGKEFKFVTGSVFTAKGATNRVKLNQLDAGQEPMVLVDNEFPVVFAEELPGMPPNRDIEIVIDLMPGTTPIYKSPYMMVRNQVVSSLV
jgi:hypothetical protein